MVGGWAGRPFINDGLRQEIFYENYKTDRHIYTHTHTAVSSTYKIDISQGKENVNTQISGKVEIRLILGAYMVKICGYFL